MRPDTRRAQDGKSGLVRSTCGFPLHPACNPRVRFPHDTRCGAAGRSTDCISPSGRPHPRRASEPVLSLSPLFLRIELSLNRCYSPYPPCEQRGAGCGLPVAALGWGGSASSSSAVGRLHGCWMRCREWENLEIAPSVGWSSGAGGRVVLSLHARVTTSLQLSYRGFVGLVGCTGGEETSVRRF
jgi:hypothetical protein